MRIVEILLVEAPHKPGYMAKVLGVIGEFGATVEGLNAVRRLDKDTIWEVTVEYDDSLSIEELSEQINLLPDTFITGKSDRVFNRHKQGKIKTVSTITIDSLEILRDVYTPGVARVCQAIQQTPSKIKDFTNLQNTVAIVTNGTAILGLGDIGPEAGLPVMEGKAAILAEIVGLSGVPILLKEKDPLKIIEIVEAISPSFGAILLEDIKAPECFTIEDELIERVNKPVFHDDQHGTAMVVLAALLSATRQARVNLKDRVFGQIGLGAAGMGICSLLIEYGVKDVVGCDLSIDAQKKLRSLGGKPLSLDEVMATADVVVATTGVRGLIKPEMVREGQIIMALTNPDPEIEPSVALENGALFATCGKVVNNMLAFPGLFKGTLDADVTKITHQMKIAVSETLSALAKNGALVPASLDRDAHNKVAEAVYKAAIKQKNEYL
ncbi:malic enzyme-like NAD(P)-binding protein [Photobacterium lipolyticum]|uniref:NADP-dependent malic enzyme n=1 Tax=Photobacterium lipolyticum TaxID=266810 RepID=A0A2T3N5D2_9GAMM|nr:malic enzyme-like NAD(P)-binding protein [Photobacterium lipolyticum]PSW07670.1 NADP-dependent malic enzyme [Photobacterium lipolyticum]